uniref:Wall-associated receptor kinase galacturonan-binding domain-containing protein n=1 Tax=Chenopodium quinoa TaxID=63459 RepID=A0A803MPU4_CHEQI
MAACLLHISAAAGLPRPRIAKPGCNDHCGNVSIPYPFGIGPNCYHNPWFDIECVNKSDSFHLKRLNNNIQGIQINLHPLKEERNFVSVVPCYRICEGDGNPRTLVFGNSDNLTGSPFLFSRKRNVLLVNGCGGGIVLLDKDNKTIAGCAAVCINNSTKQEVDCYGVGCCQTSISSSVDYYSLQVSSMGDNRIVD